ncbi:MAG: nuclear transport factor 2 family protein [Acidobacteria bacterium]|nr:nuclear transport factor 2 family protein [Acidobacteriota bacterium]MBI3489847.1 nuclear transport factor 2 family protein [Acidobacteriota bacterium]
MLKVLVSSALLLVLGIPAAGAERAFPGESTLPKSAEEQVVQGFFASFRKGDQEGVIRAFHPDCTLIAIRKGEPKRGEPYGSYSGLAGVKQFLANLGQTFDTKAFGVEEVAGKGELVFARGSFTHIVRRTGRPFSSDWSLLCRIRDGRIVEYRFLEDSAAYVEANR